MSLTRRGLLGAGAAGVAAAAGGAALAGRSDTRADTDAVPFAGAHQAGIVTPVQDQLHFVAFDLAPGTSAADLRDLLRTWSVAAVRMTAGRPVGDLGSDPLAPPADTGEAASLPPARLTVTFGLGPSLFDERFGLAGRRPPALRPLPPLPGDNLDPPAAAATCACRRAPTTRRSPSTPCATSRGSAAARRACAGRSSASGGRRRPAATSPRRAT